MRFAAIHTEWEVQFKGGHPSGASLEIFPDWKPDALITNAQCMDYSRDEFQALAGSAVVYVNTGPRDDSRIPYATMATDDRLISKIASDFFLRKRLAACAYIGSPAREQWSEARLKFFAEAMKASGRPVYVFDDQENASWNRHEKTLVSWLGKLPKPCGVFAAYDQRARQVLDACRLAGIAVPEQVQVLGVDNETYICEHTLPSLSSIAPDFNAAGYEAFAFIDRIVRRRPGTADEETRTLTIGVNGIVERNSTSDDNASLRRIADARDFIHSHATAKISVTDVAAAVAISRRLLERDFRKVTGHTILDEIQSQRLGHAAWFLKKTKTKIDTIAELCGFSSPSYLKLLFKRKFGMPMGEFRRFAVLPSSVGKPKTCRPDA